MVKLATLLIYLKQHRHLLDSHKNYNYIKYFRNYNSPLLLVQNGFSKAAEDNKPSPQSKRTLPLVINIIAISLA